jgi:hypothetical protein
MPTRLPGAPHPTLPTTVRNSLVSMPVSQCRVWAATETAAAVDSLADVLRLLDARTGSRAEVRPTRQGVLRVCAHAPRATGGSDITALRTLLTADLLSRTAELGGLQVLTAVDLTGSSPAQAAAIDDDAGALGIHPPAAHASCHDAPASLGGPVDVHLVSQDDQLDPGQDGLFGLVGAARLDRADSDPGAGGRLLSGHQDNPLAVRLALISFPGDQPAALTDDELVRAGETLTYWRQRVARWAESPSRPVPMATAEAVRAAFSDLDTVSVLTMLRGLAADASVPAGAKFETFVYADRILGLDLARDIGR